jgi:hypothetical protein
MLGSRDQRPVFPKPSPTLAVERQDIAKGASELPETDYFEPHAPSTVAEPKRGTFRVRASTDEAQRMNALLDMLEA